MEKRPTVIRDEKVAIVEEVADQLRRSSMAVLADYRGLTVSQISDLRRQLRPADVELRVVKNTLARLAARAAERDVILPSLEGPTAIAFSYGDPAALAKTLTDTIRTQRLTMPIKNGLLGDRLLSPAEVSRLADLPSREVLLSQVVGTMNSPISGLVNVLAGTLGSFLGVLEARRNQLEEGGAAASA
jgi:large subunit ribosomal protein L10